MLQGLGQQSLGFQFECFARAVLRTHLDPCRAFHGLGVLGDAEAAFLFGHRAFQGKDLGIDEDEERMTPGFILLLAQVDDRELERHADLVRGQAHARSRMHGFDHVVDQPVGGIVYGLHGGCFVLSTGSGYVQISRSAMIFICNMIDL